MSRGTGAHHHVGDSQDRSSAPMSRGTGAFFDVLFLHFLFKRHRSFACCNVSEGKKKPTLTLSQVSNYEERFVVL